MENLVPILESPYSPDAITLVRVNNPLNPMIDRESKVIDYFGESLFTIKDNYFPKNLPVITSVNGKIIQDIDLPNLTLKHGDYLVFYPTIEGGGNGMRMVAFLALAIISAFVAPYLTGLMGGMMTVGGAAGGALTATGMMVSGLIGMGINFVGGMLINALLPPTTPEQASGGNSTAYSFSPHSTQAQGIPLPKIYGLFKSHGNIITAFNYNYKDQSTANILVSFGSGPIEDIYDYKINDQRMGNTKDITFGERHGELRQEVIPAFTETKSENSYSLRIKHVSDWTPKMHLQDAAVVAYDGSLQGWKLTAQNSGIPVEMYTNPFPSTLVEGETYLDAIEGVTWLCEGKYPYQTTTIGNDFDTLELEFNFPKGLVNYDDEGNAGTVSVEVDVQISPAGQADWYSITRRPKTMASWTPNMEVTADSILSSPQGSGLYKILYLSPSTTRTGVNSVAFNTQPFACTVESTNINNPLNSWIKAYIGDINGPNAGVANDVSSQLNGNILNSGYNLELNHDGTYLYCLLDNNMTLNHTIGIYLMSYVMTGATGAVNLHAEYLNKKGDWTEFAGSGQNLSTDNDFRFIADLLKPKRGKKNYWYPNSFSEYGSGHWMRFYFDVTDREYPVIGLFRPQKANPGATDGIIVYTEARKSYAYPQGAAPNNGTWSAGYWTTTSGYLENYSLWVEAVPSKNDHYYGSHTDGAPYEDAGWKLWDRRGAIWRYITSDCYVIFASNLERSKKFSSRTQKSSFFTLRTPNIYPHGYYDVKVERITADANPKNTSISDEMYLTNIREIVYDDFSYPRHALLGVKALATEKLSGSLDISAVIKGLVTQVNRPDEVIGSNGYNYRCKTYLPNPTVVSHMPITGSSWSTYFEQGGSSAVENNITFSAVTNYSATPTWVTEYTTNPAWVCYDILSQPVIGMPTEVVVGDYSFECVISNTATALNQPLYGQDWSKFWQLSGDIGIGDTWSTGMACTARPIIRYEGIDPSRLVLASFKTLADYCDELVYDENGVLERRHEFNGIFDAEKTLWEAALKVTEMCRSSLIWNGMNIAIVTDVKATLPTDAVQLFTSGNILPDSFKETFLPMEERVSEVEISFLNRAKDWERDTISIYNPDSLTLSNKASIEPLGITKASQAWRHAQYLVNRNKYLKRTIEFETDLEAIACTVGDVFYFQNEVPRWGIAGGRISAFATPTTITLDQTITMSATSSYGIMLRLQDDTLVTKPLISYTGSFSTVTATTPFAILPQQYDPYSFGIQDSEAKVFRTINISQSSDQRAKITAIEYDADVYLDDEEVALPDTGDTWTEATKIRPVTSLTLMELPSIGTADTVGKRSIAISFKRPVDDFNYRTARVWYKYNKIDEVDTSNDAWALLTETSGITATIPEVIPNYRYTVCVTSVAKDNIESLWEESPKASYNVSDVSFQSTLLLDTRISGLQIIGNPNSTTFIGTDCSISWNPSIVLSGNTVAGGVANSTNLMESGIAFTTSDADSLVADGNKVNPNDVTGVGSRLYQSPNAKGAGISIPQTWFKDYEVDVYNYVTGTLLRTEYVTDPFYTYTYDKNYVDNNTQLATQIQIDVKARDVNLNSSIPSTLLAYNPSIADPVSIDRLSNAGVGDNLLISSDTVSRNDHDYYLLLKEIRLAIAGNYRISFDLCSSNTNAVAARLYKNGVAIGTERTTTSTDPTYETFTEDIDGWEATDLCQIWAKRVSTAATAKVINFRVYEQAPIVPLVTQDLDLP